MQAEGCDQAQIQIQFEKYLQQKYIEDVQA